MTSRGLRKTAAILALALGLAAAGCLNYDADIRVRTDGRVSVHERFVLDPDWVAQAGDTFRAAGRVMTNVEKEGKNRGGKVTRFGDDSAYVDFDYPSLAAFARAWPDSSDEGKMWDRSLYHRRSTPSGPVDELILWRQSPPEHKLKRNPNDRMPVMSFWVTLPVAATQTNAHRTMGRTYGWRFSEEMTKTDSVWVVWPATGTAP